MTLFELQTASGQLWLSISEHFAAKDATIASLTSERDAHAKTIADYLAADDAGKAKMLADAAKSAEQKERDAAQAEFDNAKAKLDAAKAKLDEIPAP
jgi:hypothetical protein